jgi:Domain of unknown function (DUF4468) with TBP-like fold
MYRYLLLSLTLLLSLQIYSQDSLDTSLTYTQVVKVDSTLSSNELYLRARAWFAESYRSAHDVIQMDDKDNGKIIGKGNLRYLSNIFEGSDGTKGWIRYTISIQVKNGRYKYEITDFYHEGNPLSSGGECSFGLITNSSECPYKIGAWARKGWKNKVWKDIKETIEKNITSLMESITIAMGKPAKNKDSDW